MAKTNYIQRVRGSNASCMMSIMCSECFRRGLRVAFFGEAPNGAHIMGTRDIDHDFTKRIYQAAQKHLRAVHAKEIVANAGGGWKLRRVRKGDTHHAVN